MGCFISVKLSDSLYNKKCYFRTLVVLLEHTKQ